MFTTLAETPRELLSCRSESIRKQKRIPDERFRKIISKCQVARWLGENGEGCARLSRGAINKLFEGYICLKQIAKHRHKGQGESCRPKKDTPLMTLAAGRRSQDGNCDGCGDGDKAAADGRQPHFVIVVIVAIHVAASLHKHDLTLARSLLPIRIVLLFHCALLFNSGCLHGHLFRPVHNLCLRMSNVAYGCTFSSLAALGSSCHSVA